LIKIFFSTSPLLLFFSPCKKGIFLYILNLVFLSSKRIDIMELANYEQQMKKAIAYLEQEFMGLQV
jgi:hypothetical protein